MIMRTIVVGAGPAGLMASARSAICGNEVILIDRNEKPGKKLYITGKGRCNFTNACPPKDFLESVVTNPKFLYGALFSFTPKDAIDLIENNGIKTKVERGNRAFPLSDKASDITKAIFKYATDNGVKFVSETVLSISKQSDTFNITTNKQIYESESVILCCGGLSYPTTGSTGDGYNFAQNFGHKIVKQRPALVPILLKTSVKSLEGLSLKNVRATIKNYSLFGEMLFTANGVSGPIILSLSSLACSGQIKGEKLYIDLKPALDGITLDKRVLSDFAKFKNKQLKNALGELLPKRLIPFIISYCGIDGEKSVNNISKEERNKLVVAIKNLEFVIDTLDDIKHAIVTAGGVDVTQVNPKTMESKLVKGLYFAGEMLDIDALTGGYNIQIALSTGYMAGNATGRKIND